MQEKIHMKMIYFYSENNKNSEYGLQKINEINREEIDITIKKVNVLNQSLENQALINQHAIIAVPHLIVFKERKREFIGEDATKVLDRLEQKITEKKKKKERILN